MKKLVLLMLVFSMAVVANAGMFISVNGVVNPPDSSITIEPSDVLIIDMHGDGLTGQGAFYLGLQGPGSLGIGNATIPYAGSSKDLGLDFELGAVLGTNSPVINVTLTDPVLPPATPKPLTGLLVDGIQFHCDGPGDVTILLFDGDGNVLDEQIIHQVPEPMTVALLGLGGLFLRRRIA